MRDGAIRLVLLIRRFSKPLMVDERKSILCHVTDDIRNDRPVWGGFSCTFHVEREIADVTRLYDSKITPSITDDRV